MTNVFLRGYSCSCMCFSNVPLWSVKLHQALLNVCHWALCVMDQSNLISRECWKIGLCVYKRREENKGLKAKQNSVAIPKTSVQLDPSICCKFWFQFTMSFLKSSTGSSGKQLTDCSPQLRVWLHAYIWVCLFLLTKPFLLSTLEFSMAQCHALEKHEN